MKPIDDKAESVGASVAGLPALTAGASLSNARTCATVEFCSAANSSAAWLIVGSCGQWAGVNPTLAHISLTKELRDSRSAPAPPAQAGPGPYNQEASRVTPAKRPNLELNDTGMACLPYRRVDRDPTFQNLLHLRP